MKSVRIFYTKKGSMRFISHLDMTRFMTRMLRRAGLPIWYTEGFHPHAYMTFALPLSLGFESEYEIMDIRLTEEISDGEVTRRLNDVFPEYIRAFAAAEPILKAGKIAAAEFSVDFSDNGAIKEKLDEFLKSKEIVVSKKTKRGDQKLIDIAPKIKSYSISLNDGDTQLLLTLPAGGEDNINPELLLSAFFGNNDYYSYKITRTALLDGDLRFFK